ncbi:MAG TPA: methyltransferase domain-containing protein [Candidatus Binataceae bacterium]|nr:methyltransferase domain-containing protein [Candidatus Binataceae bacterium]
MNRDERALWNERHRGKSAGDAEPFFVEMLARMPKGLALDIAAGRGRHSIPMARAGMRVVAVDIADAAMRALKAVVDKERLAIFPAIANLDTFFFGTRCFDAIVNTNFLDRALFPKFIDALKPGGVLLADTFLIDQARTGHPRDPRFLLKHGELRELMNGLDIAVYREGLVTYRDGSSAWRGSALGVKRS